MKENKINFYSIDELEKKLESFGVDIRKWGIGQAKTLEHLQKELLAGESELVVRETKLLRKVAVSVADVIYNSVNGIKYVLKEEKQVFADGRERCRKVCSAVSEKIKIGEKPRNALIRGIKEELSICDKIILKKNKRGVRISCSTSYPGLPSLYIRHCFLVILNDHQFNLKGYTEKQEDKTTFFVWKVVN